MNVAVTGASGYVGREVVKTLIDRGYRVRAIARGSSRTGWLGDKVESVQADVTQPAMLQGAFDGMDAVIHLVGIIVETGLSSFETIHCEGTRNVVAEAQRAGIQRYVHMSALGARAGAPSRYHRTKWEAEQIVRSSTLRWTIFRPSIIFGERDEFLNLFAKIARFGPAVPVVGGGTMRLQPIWVGDVAHCFAAALKTEAALGKSYDLGGSRPYTLKALIQLVVRARCHLPRLLLPLPMPVARVNAILMEWLLSKPPLTREQLIMLQEDNVCDATPAAEDFGRTWKSLEAYLGL